MKNIAIWASGSGSNAEVLVRHFEGHPSIRVVAVQSNSPKAGVIARLKPLGIQVEVFDRKALMGGDVLDSLRKRQVDTIILAGFLWLVPSNIVLAFPDQILNIHPALLPDFGGQGMYGDRVHQAVLAAGKTESGITIHLVNEVYDKGAILFQTTCPVFATDTVATLADRIHGLEHKYYPQIVESYLTEGN